MLSSQVLPSRRLLDQIEDRVTQSAYLILNQALENVGECTYAEYYPIYRELIRTLFRTRPHQFIRRGDFLRRDIREAAEQMYRQPCLVCEWCQRRRKPWVQQARE
jgi:hypothetical protein